MNKRQIDNALFGFGVDSYNRFQTFLKIAPELRGQYYWYGLRHSYDLSDNLFNFRDEVRGAFRKTEPGKQALMTKKERAYLQGLPEQLVIYRGMTIQEYESKKFGVSWTLKKEIADFFVSTYLRNHATNNLNKMVHKLTIKKNEIIAFFNERQEYEIIYINTI